MGSSYGLRAVGLVCALWATNDYRACFAATIGFLPGDCCFVMRLDEALLDEIDAAESPVFSYSTPDWYEGAMCGSSGYWRLQYTGMPGQLKSSLRTVYKDVRKYQPQELRVDIDEETGAKTLTEINPLRVLIVNADYSARHDGVVSKYNENWSKEALTWGRNGAHPIGAYVPLVKTPDVIIHEWARGAEIAPLNVTIPTEISSTVGDAYLTPMTSKSELKFIVLTSEFEAYAKLDDSDDDPYDDEVDLYTVESSGITHLTWSSSKNSWRTDEEVLKDEEELGLNLNSDP